MRKTSDFERWTHVNMTSVSASRLAPLWATIAAVICVAAVIAAIAVLRSGSARAGLVFVGLTGLVVLFLRTWLILTARARRYLVSRDDLGDVTRLALLSGLFVAVPIAGTIAATIVLLALQAIDVALARR